MAIPFDQGVATTFDRVSNARNKAADQWSDSSFLMFLERNGGLVRVDGGDTLVHTIDYQQNPGAAFLALSTTATATAETEILTQTQYEFVPFVTPVTWTLTAEAKNSAGNKKVDLITSIVNNGISSHDQAFEDALTAATGGTNGFNTIVDLYTEDGTGTVGSIVAGTETWWANQFKDWGTDTGATLLGDYETLWDSCAKGSMGRKPNVVIGSATMQANFVAANAANQRYVNTNTLKSGFTEIAFKSAPYVFTGSYTSDSAWMYNTADTKVEVIRGAWRQRRSAVEHVNAAVMTMKIFSVAQFATRNRSRGGVLFT